MMKCFRFYRLALGCGLLAGCALGAQPPAQAPAPEPAPCTDFERDVERFWSSSSQQQLSAGVLGVGEPWAEQVGERVVEKMGELTRDWVSTQEDVCKARVVRRVMPEDVYQKVRLCLRSSLTAQRTLVETLKHAKREHLFNVAAALAKVQEQHATCDDEAVYSAFAEEAEDKAARLARQRATEARVYRELKDERAVAAGQAAEQAAQQSRSTRVKVDALLEEGYTAISKAAFQEAEEKATQALGLAEADQYELGQANAYNLLGGAHYERGTGYYPRALEVYQKAEALRSKLLGHEHPHTANSYYNIGLVHQAEGRYEQALEMHQKALAIRLKVLGEAHPDTANSYGNLGVVAYAQKAYAEALEMHQKALAIRLKILGEGHPDTASSYNHLGVVQHALRAYPEAFDMHQKALAIQVRALGEEHPDTTNSKRWIERLCKTGRVPACSAQ